MKVHQNSPNKFLKTPRKSQKLRKIVRIHENSQNYSEIPEMGAWKIGRFSEAQVTINFQFQFLPNSGVALDSTKKNEEGKRIWW